MKFFADSFGQLIHDGRVVQFNDSPEYPAPPVALLYEHFKQAVLANMKGAGNVPFLSFDPDEDSQSLASFDGPEGKSLFEEVMKSKLGEENDRTWRGENMLHVL